MVGGIRSVSPFSALTDGANQIENEDFYCEHCMVVGVKSKLEKRLWVFNNESKELEAVADQDRENFRMCYTCGDIFPIYELKVQPKIQDFVEPIDNPFDNNPQGIESYNPKYSLKKKRSKHKDPEIQEFLDRGDNVTNINDS
jgi:hypothetical protein